VPKQPNRDISDAGTRAILRWYANVANGSQAMNRDIAANLDEQQNKLTLQRKIMQE
jgi:hypothetical protein